MASVSLQVAEKNADPDRLDRITRQLRRELLEANAGAVEFVAACAPGPHAKAADPVTLGALALAVLPAAIPKLIEFLQAWALRSSGRSIKVTAEVDGRVVTVECSGAVSQQELGDVLKQALGRE